MTSSPSSSLRHSRCSYDGMLPLLPNANNVTLELFPPLYNEKKVIQKDHTVDIKWKYLTALRM